MFDFFKKRHRAALRAEAMPEAWREILEKNVPYYRLLGADDQHALEARVRIFLAEKSFEGCGGLEITEEIRVTVAGQACILVLHRDEDDLYPGLESILVYPEAYRVKREHREGAVVIEGDEVLLGESWERGTLVLAWDHVNAATHHLPAGHNVVLHEFAHQLDGEAGGVDGAPELDSRARYVVWAQVLGAEYEALTKRVLAGRSTDIDAYATTSPAEFFAVVTEQFFERPGALQRHHPALYAELQGYYRQDPAALVVGGRGQAG